MAEAPLTVSDLLGAIWRRKVRVLVVSFVILAMVIGVIIVYPKSYGSQAGLLVRVGRESVTLDPTVTIGPTISMQQDRQKEINSLLEVLHSRALAEGVVERLGAEAVRGEDAGPAPESFADRIQRLTTAIKSTLVSQVKTLLRLPPLSDREIAVRTLQDSLSFDSPKLSNVITISGKADSPQQAQQIVAAYCDVYREQHVRLHHSSGSFAFFVDQTDKLAAELTAAEAALRDAKNEFGMLSVDGRRAMLEQQIAAVEARLLSNEVELDSARSKVAALKQRSDGLPPTIVTQETSGFANEARDGMRQQLYQFEAQERKLRQEMTDKHPEMITVRKQLDELRKILDEQTEGRTQTTSGVNPAHQKLTLDSLAEETQVASLEKGVDTLNDQRERLEVAMRELNGQEMQIAKLQRNVDVLRENYRTHIQRLEQARVDDALAADKISNVVVFQPATLQERPVSPNVPMMLLLGLIAAASAGLGSALLGGIRPPVANPAMSRRPTVPRGNGKRTPTPVSVSSALH